MRYEDTWFNKHPMTIYGSSPFGRLLWIHHYIEIIGNNFAFMNRKNEDGSIDVLGVPVTKIGSGLSYGGYNRTAMQKSLAEHEEPTRREIQERDWSVCNIASDI